MFTLLDLCIICHFPGSSYTPHLKWSFFSLLLITLWEAVCKGLTRRHTVFTAGTAQESTIGCHCNATNCNSNYLFVFAVNEHFYCLWVGLLNESLFLCKTFYVALSAGSHNRGNVLLLRPCGAQRLRRLL